MLSISKCAIARSIRYLDETFRKVSPLNKYPREGMSAILTKVQSKTALKRKNRQCSTRKYSFQSWIRSSLKSSFSSCKMALFSNLKRSQLAAKAKGLKAGRFQARVAKMSHLSANQGAQIWVMARFLKSKSMVSLAHSSTSLLKTK